MGGSVGSVGSGSSGTTDDGGWAIVAVESKLSTVWTSQSCRDILEWERGTDVPDRHTALNT